MPARWEPTATLWEAIRDLGVGPGVDVYVDFDGTIAPAEPTDRLFDRFADPSWRAIDQAWQAGELKSWEAMAQNVALLRATPEQLTGFLRTVPIDPAFPAFVDLCRRGGARVTVVSDGLDLVLATVLGAAGIALPCLLAGNVDMVVLDDSYHVVTVDRQRHVVAERTVA